ncbi:MAG: hypothetical protein JW864_01840 [Spirochaetes bacterium]|nr:hypothetical protein [Spirochaetota bacterium]
MKVVHIIKRIETVDEDIKDLRKLEKSLSKDKSFSTPIYISIEKQINLLLDKRIKLLGLTIADPPADLVKEIEGHDAEDPKKAKTSKSTKSAGIAKKSRPKKAKSSKASGEKEETDNIGIMTQDFIDEKFNRLKEEKEKEEKEKEEKRNTHKMSSDDLEDEDEDDDYDENVDDMNIKLLDIALEKGSLSKSAQEKEKKKVRFFKDNFPGGEY